MGAFAFGASSRRRCVAVLTVVAAGFLVATASASACVGSGSPPSRWYGIFDKTSATQNNGLFADIYVSSSGVADYTSGGHINETIWEAVANATDAGQYWVEGGWTHGWQGSSDLTFYWARNTPSNGYAEHRVNNATPSVGTWEPVQISYDGNGIWGVYFNYTKATSGDGSTASISASAYSRGYEGGLESTSSSSYAAATYANYLEYETTGGSWTSSIDSGSTLYCDSPATSSWVTTNVEHTSSMN